MPLGSGEADGQFREAIRWPALMLVGGAGTQRQDGRTVGDQAGCGGTVGIAQPEARIGRRIEAEDAADLLDPVEPLAANPLDPADLSRPEQAGDRRVAEVDDEVPAGADGHQPQVQPMAVMLALLQDDDALDIGRIGQQRHDDPAADHGDAGIVMVVDQVCEQAARQDEIADPAVADEQNAQSVPPDAQWRTIAARRPRAKKSPCQKAAVINT